MVTVCLVSHGHPAANPRLVREADALAGAGYRTVAATPSFVPHWVPFDRELTGRAAWRHACVDFLGSERARWHWARLRRRAAAAAARVLASEALVARAVNYANPELADLAAAQGADLYIAHQHHALPAAAWAAQRCGAALAFDAEDLLADSGAEPVALIRGLERRYLGRCAYVSTMSGVAAARLRETNGLATDPLVLHNVPSLGERAGLREPGEALRGPHPSLYWFGQTIGPHSRAEQVIRAMPLLRRPVRLVLRGKAAPGYAEALRSLASRLGVASRLEILPPAAPGAMVRLAAQHDVLLGTQPGAEPFHQLAIGNKVFAGMMAGLALALTDTVAHRALRETMGGGALLFRDDDEHDLATVLNGLLERPEDLIAMKRRCWDLAQARFNWEVESRAFLARVAGVTGGAE